MNKQKLLPALVGIGVMLMAGTASAAKSGKGGFFFGLEGDYDGVNYTHYISKAATGSVELQDPAVAPHTSTGNNYAPYLVLGQRFYLNNVLGFGVKTWAGAAQYNHKSIYQANVGNSKNLGDFTSKADAAILGFEAQMYVDLLNFTNSALGLTLGAGYELTQFYNVSATTDFSSATVTNIDSYSDSSYVLDVALHYQIGARNRFDVGYKIKDYTKVASYIRPSGDNFRNVGFNANSSIYVSYTFSF